MNAKEKIQRGVGATLVAFSAALTGCGSAKTNPQPTLEQPVKITATETTEIPTLTPHP